MVTTIAFAVGWCLWTAFFITWESLALLNKNMGDTLSENTRLLFRVRTSKAGRAIFLVVWAGFAVWFPMHILTEAV